MLFRSWDAVSGLEIMDYVDVLVDGEFVPELKDNQLHWRGSGNQNVIDVKASKEQGCMVLHCT